MGLAKSRAKNFRIRFIKAEGNPEEIVASLLAQNVSSVLAKHNAIPSVNIKELIQNHILKK